MIGQLCRKLIFPVIFLSLMAVIPPLQAKMVSVTGVGSITYKEELTAQIKSRAIETAKFTAFKKFMSKQPQARKSVFSRLEDKFRANLPNIIVEHVVQREKNDEENKKYSVLLSVKIDPGEFERLFSDLSNVGGKLTGRFGAMFIARVQVSDKAFDVKRTSIEKSESAQKVQDTSVSGGGKSLDASEKSSFSKKQTGGSRVRKRNRAVYEANVELGETLDNVVGEFLNSNGFQPVEPSDLQGVALIDELIEEGRLKRGRMKTRDRKKYLKAAHRAGWKYFGIGTVSVGTPRQDPVRGNQRMSAQVSFKVYDVAGKYAKTVATVRKTTVFANGNDIEALETLVANKAATKAMQTVLGILQKEATR